jgi:excisionase family DNA binding protein
MGKGRISHCPWCRCDISGTTLTAPHICGWRGDGMGKRTAAPDGWVGTAEAARLLGVSRQRVAQLLEESQLEGWRIGHPWLVSRASIERRLKLAP